MKFLKLLKILMFSIRGRYNYLLEFFPVASCLGVPVDSISTQKYALMLLDSYPRTISKDDVLYVEAAGLAIGAVLDRQLMHDRYVSLQQTTLLGHLTRGLVHEINNQVGRSYNLLSRLKSNLRQIENAKVVEEKNLENALESVNKLDDAISSLTKTTRQFGRIIKRPKKEFLRLDELVTSSFMLLEEQRDRSNADLKIIFPESMMVIRSQGSSVEQVLINILLNALQQIEDSEFCKDGVVLVRFEAAETKTGEAIYRIIIEDTGPGIHKSLWDRVFEIGFTTRKDGSGMGLYISRSLVEALDGRLFIEESFILGGSVFVIELPRNI